MLTHPQAPESHPLYLLEYLTPAPPLPHVVNQLPSTRVVTSCSGESCTWTSPDSSFSTSSLPPTIVVASVLMSMTKCQDYSSEVTLLLMAVFIWVYSLTPPCARPWRCVWSKTGQSPPVWRLSSTEEPENRQANSRPNGHIMSRVRAEHSHYNWLPLCFHLDVWLFLGLSLNLNLKKWFPSSLKPVTWVTSLFGADFPDSQSIAESWGRIPQNLCHTTLSGLGCPLLKFFQ